MLQFTARETSQYTMAETAQMALEGGCRWIEMDFGHPAEGDAERVREVASAVKEMCQEAGAFLVIRDRLDDAKALGLHGVYLSMGGLKAACDAREALGPEAVVGFMAFSPDDIFEAERLDLDYATLPPQLTLDEAALIISSAKAMGLCVPAVHLGDVTPATLPEVLGVGYQGVNIAADQTKADITGIVKALLEAK